MRPTQTGRAAESGVFAPSDAQVNPGRLDRHGRRPLEGTAILKRRFLEAGGKRCLSSEKVEQVVRNVVRILEVLRGLRAVRAVAQLA